MSDEDLFDFLERDMLVIPCESPQHGKSRYHSGTGEWYITYVCPRCSNGSVPMVCCDMFKQYLPVVLILNGNSVVECNKCRNKFLSRETIIQAEKRKT